MDAPDEPTPHEALPWYRYWATDDESAAEPEPDALFHVKHDEAEAAEVVSTPEAAEAISAPEAAGPPVDEAPLDIVLPDATEDAPPPTHFERGRVVTIANQKGGVGKTTTAVSLSAALAQFGARVLLVDFDPQGNASSGLGLRVQQGQPTIYHVLVGDVDIVDAIEPTSVRNLFVVPANGDLAGAEIELVSAFSREQRLRKALESVRSEFDVILVDCPPTLGLLTVNALTAGDGVIVPIQCEYYALEGLGALQRNAELIREQLNPELEVVGYLLTMLDARTRLSQQVVDEVEAHFGEQVFKTRIPRSVRLAEAPGFGQPITIFDPGSRAALAYTRLAREVLERLAASVAAEGAAT